MYKWDLFVPCARIFPIQTSDTGTASQQVHKCVAVTRTSEQVVPPICY